MDPVVVLRDDGDDFLMQLRAAFMEVVQRDKKEEAAKNKP